MRNLCDCVARYVLVAFVPSLVDEPGSSRCTHFERKRPAATRLPVLPDLPLQQFVFTLPFALRDRVAFDPEPPERAGPRAPSYALIQTPACGGRRNSAAADAERKPSLLEPPRATR